MNDYLLAFFLYLLGLGSGLGLWLLVHLMTRGVRAVSRARDRRRLILASESLLDILRTLKGFEAQDAASIRHWTEKAHTNNGRPHRLLPSRVLLADQVDPQEAAMIYDFTEKQRATQ